MSHNAFDLFSTANRAQNGLALIPDDSGATSEWSPSRSRAPIGFTRWNREEARTPRGGYVYASLLEGLNGNTMWEEQIRAESFQSFQPFQSVRYRGGSSQARLTRIGLALTWKGVQRAICIPRTSTLFSGWHCHWHSYGVRRTERGHRCWHRWILNDDVLLYENIDFSLQLMAWMGLPSLKPQPHLFGPAVSMTFCYDCCLYRPTAEKGLGTGQLKRARFDWWAPLSAAYCPSP